MKIEKSKYEGYLWYSDQTEPEVIYNYDEFELEINDNANPFIIEGQLFDGKKSISIRYVDGKYYKQEFIMEELAGVDYTPKVFKAHRMGNQANLYFNQYWRPEPDELCENMDVLQPAELVFIGFNKKEEEK